MSHNGRIAELRTSDWTVLEAARIALAMALKDSTTLSDYECALQPHAVSIHYKDPGTILVKYNGFRITVRHTTGSMFLITLVEVSSGEQRYGELSAEAVIIPFEICPGWMLQYVVQDLSKKTDFFVQQALSLAVGNELALKAMWAKKELPVVKLVGRNDEETEIEVQVNFGIVPPIFSVRVRYELTEMTDWMSGVTVVTANQNYSFKNDGHDNLVPA